MVDLSRLAAALGAREVHLVHEEELARIFADCEPGALVPFGNLYGLDVFVDESITKDTHVEFRAGTHTDTIGISYADFARLVEPKLINAARHR